MNWIPQMSDEGFVVNTPPPLEYSWFARMIRETATRPHEATRLPDPKKAALQRGVTAA
jgi:hypothetical protein